MELLIFSIYMEGEIRANELYSQKFRFKQFYRLNYSSIKLIGFRSKPSLKRPVRRPPYIYAYVTRYTPLYISLCIHSTKLTL